jgi:hypothetical protein
MWVGVSPSPSVQMCVVSAQSVLVQMWAWVEPIQCRFVQMGSYCLAAHEVGHVQHGAVSKPVPTHVVREAVCARVRAGVRAGVRVRAYMRWRACRTAHMRADARSRGMRTSG